MKTLEQSINELTEAWRDLSFEFAYMIGSIWLINRIKYLKLKPWVVIRLKKKLNNFSTR